MEHIPSDVILKRESPKYPLKAKRGMIEDTVSVKILINESGIVEKACAVSGRKIFWTSAEIAAIKWRFKPQYGIAFSTRSKHSEAKRYAYAFIAISYRLKRG